VPKFTDIMHIWISFLFEINRALKIKMNALWKRNSTHNYFGYGNKVMNASDGNIALKRMIIAGEPFCVARLGTSESHAIKRCLMKKARLARNVRHIEIHTLHQNAGFFPPEEGAVQQYTETILSLMPEVDMYACWNTAMENHFVRSCLKKKRLAGEFSLSGTVLSRQSVERRS